MNKTKLIDYLSKQYNLPNKNIGFEAYKQSIISVLDDVFGLGNKYTFQLMKVNILQKESLEELYPKMVDDEEKSIYNFDLILQQIIDQIDLLEPEKLTKSDKLAQTNHKIFLAIQKYFSDVEIENLKAIVADKKISKENLTEHLRIIETDKRLNLLTELLDDVNIFK